MIRSLIDTRLTDTVIRIEGVAKTFGELDAVDELTFEFAKGKIIGLIGPSGCGRTIAVRLMTGIYHSSKVQTMTHE